MYCNGILIGVPIVSTAHGSCHAAAPSASEKPDATGCILFRLGLLLDRHSTHLAMWQDAGNRIRAGHSAQIVRKAYARAVETRMRQALWPLDDDRPESPTWFADRLKA